MRILAASNPGIALLACCAAVHAVPGVDDDSIRHGLRVYRDGVLPSGEAVRAVVAGDVPIEGTQFSCMSCHQRSGLGNLEGWVATPAVTAEALRAPREGPRPRPPYTAATLGRAIREGVDPAGNRLDPAMPRYALSERDLAALLAYLRTLSAEAPPGVTASSVHFATVIAPGAAPAARDAMLGVLDAYFGKTMRAQHYWARTEDERGPLTLQSSFYRDWKLSVWVLEGPPADWSGQLERYYREEPVFALISGIGAGTWQPVHDFCEDRQIPCLFPNTDVPVEAGDDFYSLYFRDGVALEARAVARHLLLPDVGMPGARILQIFRQGETGTALARALRGAADGTVSDVGIPEGREVEIDLVARLAASAKPDVIALWLDGRDLARLGPLSDPATAVPRIYLSSTLLGSELSSIPEAIRGASFVAHPFTLPEEFDRRFRRVELWMKRRNIEMTQPRIQAQTYFACTMAAEGLRHIERGYSRERFLESLDHVPSSFPSTFSASYPRPSFGPGQRFLSKGCYVIEPDRGQPGGLAERSRWVVP